MGKCHGDFGGCCYFLRGKTTTKSNGMKPLGERGVQVKFGE